MTIKKVSQVLEIDQRTSIKFCAKIGIKYPNPFKVPTVIFSDCTLSQKVFISLAEGHGHPGAPHQ